VHLGPARAGTVEVRPLRTGGAEGILVPGGSTLEASRLNQNPPGTPPARRALLAPVPHYRCEEADAWGALL
jgi:hypothetical protein